MSHDTQRGTSTQFDLHLATQLAHAARAIYLPGDKVRAYVVENLHMDDFSFFDSDHTQACVAANEDRIVVAFRGTEPTTIADWITDLDMDLMRGPLGGQVHAGFYDGLSNVWCELDEQVRRLQGRKPRSLYVTGHSLGGALANLAVARWIEMRRPAHGLYTFGQPRTGDRAFALNFDFVFKPCAFRFVNGCDIVSRVPPRILGYRHTGTFRYFNKDGELVESIGWWRAFMQRWNGGVERILDWCGHGVKDHSMVRYCELLEAARSTLPTVPYHRHETEPRRAPQATFANLVRPRRRAA